MRQKLGQYLLSLFHKDKALNSKSASEKTNTEEQEQHEKPDHADEARSDDAAKREPLPETVPFTSERSLIHERQATDAGREPRLEVASRCHVGKVRRRNEDSSFLFVSQAGGTEPLPLFGLFIVADGMGGHSDGHRASKLVSRTVAQHILDRVYRSLLHEGQNGMMQPVQEAMEEAVVLANKMLAGVESGKEMGTTLTAAIILGSRLFLMHIGDSRGYLMHQNELSLVTTDHTFVQALQDAGQLTAEEAAIHPSRNLLYRALMGEAMEEPVDVFTRILPQQGCLVLCSDGLWGTVSENTMSAILNQDIDLQEKADRLLEAALQAGGGDNITFILVSFLF